MPRCLTCGGEEAGFAFVFESEALAVDADDNRVVQDPKQLLRKSSRSIKAERCIPRLQVLRTAATISSYLHNGGAKSEVCV